MFFSNSASKAKTLGIKIMVEPLSSHHCVTMTDPHQIGRLVELLAEPFVFTILLDTGHLLDSGYNLNQFLATWTHLLEELQLKGPRSTPPPPDFPFERWPKLLPVQPTVLCMEHRQPITLDGFRKLIASVSSESADMGTNK